MPSLLPSSPVESKRKSLASKAPWNLSTRSLPSMPLSGGAGSLLFRRRASSRSLDTSPPRRPKPCDENSPKRCIRRVRFEEEGKLCIPIEETQEDWTKEEIQKSWLTVSIIQAWRGACWKLLLNFCGLSNAQCLLYAALISTLNTQQ